MSTIRPIDLPTDLPMLRRWWDAHKSLPVPENMLPQGFLITAGGVDIAAAFLYLDVGGKIAVVEYLTTNPTVAFSRYLIEDVKKLIDHIERCATAGGNIVILSFVRPGTGEERLLHRLGYRTDDGPAHKIYAKPLIKEVT